MKLYLRSLGFNINIWRTILPISILDKTNEIYLFSLKNFFICFKNPFKIKKQGKPAHKQVSKQITGCIKVWIHLFFQRIELGHFRYNVYQSCPLSSRDELQNQKNLLTVEEHKYTSQMLKESEIHLFSKNLGMSIYRF